MTTNELRSLRSSEGRQVSVALRDGSRLDDCCLVSSGRSRVGSLWLFVNGEDVFVALSDVVDVWEPHAHPSRAV